MVHIMLTTFDEEIHRSRFRSREKMSQRTSRKYLRNFRTIRLIQEYLYRIAVERNVPVVENIDFDETREKALEIITDSLVEKVKLEV
jgi:2-phosphoglycerate kinase